MKYQSSNTRLIYLLDFDKKRNLCPECSEGRKKKNAKDLEYYKDTNKAYCFHCETTFFEFDGVKEKQYTLPQWKNITNLTDKAVKWFTSRMISQNTLNEMRIYSDFEYMPQLDKKVEVICFPFFKNDELINIKYRGPQKIFKLHSGSELIFYNYDALLKNDEIIICEGEIDLLTYVENGYKNIISVPNGAGKNTEYLDNCIELFDNVKKVTISTDFDTKGIILRDELIRRVGVEKCYLVNFKGCKDANEYFCKNGGIEFKEAVKNASMIKVKGLVCIADIEERIDSLYENGLPEGNRIKHSLIDEFIRLETKQLLLVTGIPSSGKSEYIDYILTRMNIEHGWKIAYFTPENYPLEYHYSKIHEKISGDRFKKGYGTDVYHSVKEYCKENFFYIMNEEDLSVDNVLQGARYYVKKYGIKALVLDPYNMFDHKVNTGQTETQYVSEFLDKLRNFAKFNDILVVLVAHPSKIMPDQVPSLYSISGSAHFYNKADYGITVHRLKNDDGSMGMEVDIHVQKCRFKNYGKQGVIQLKYNYKNGRYEDRNNTVDQYDNSCYLKPGDKRDEIFNWNNLNERELPF